MTIYYHVAHDYDGGDLFSLYNQHGDCSYDLYLDKWPESGNLGQVHAHVIHLHQSLGDAIDYKDNFGGQILAIDAADLDIIIDDYEYPHPVCRDIIPANKVSIQC